MSRIKYTIVPKENIERSIFESGVKLSKSDIIIDPIVVFNANMELGIETEIYGDDIDEDNFKFTKESNLLNVLTEINDTEITNTIIVNGFDVDLDYVRNHIVKLANKSDKIYSINVISDARKYTNFTIYMDSKENVLLTDEEWKEYKENFKKEFEKSLSKDTEDNGFSSSIEEEANKAISDLLKAVLGTDEINDDEDDDDEGLLSIDLKEAPLSCILPMSKDKGDYEVYSYANSNNMITIEKDNGTLIIMDEKNEIVVPIEFKDFIIETLKKLK